MKWGDRWNGCVRSNPVCVRDRPVSASSLWSVLALQPAASTKTLMVEKHPRWPELRHSQNKYWYSFEKWGFEQRDKTRQRHKKKTKKKKNTSMNASIVPGFEIVIHHIITPARQKTSISPRKEHVSMENQRILAHNRSGAGKGGVGSKGSKARLKKAFCVKKRWTMLTFKRWQDCEDPFSAARTWL